MKEITPGPCFIETLSELPLFQNLEKEQAAALLRCARIGAFDPGEYLFREGDPASGFFIIKAGRVKVRRISPSGREVVLHLAHPPEMIGCKALTLPGSCYPADGVALETVIALGFTRKQFLREMQGSADVFFSLLVDLNRRLSEIYSLQSSLQEPVNRRVATLLLRQALPQDVALEDWQKHPVKEVHITKSLIAAIVGTTTETAIRILSKWKKAGWISSKRGAISLVDVGAIFQITQAEHQPIRFPMEV
ncbi:Crp/Fnr family transcriptional regulator [Sulfidibacter corallicola]|uniref:Crp/Fnr family transcriptional regulator n=1 Tax=Sulfidibacter corallicola TaxID=2818388 RepID=A0A8A4TMX8_SULCO|nr:Crp/Fnr family transcriptional regulator [Sulfidibacter corallicola]QTD51326.1 Crp/Fnr family transcriptional regulator [Sulfidibacter corallicola]